MRTSTLVSAIAFVVAGSLELGTAPEAVASNASFCFICVPPPIMCIDFSEWDEDCQDHCGANSAAQGCPFDDPLCGSPALVMVNCLESE